MDGGDDEGLSAWQSETDVDDGGCVNDGVDGFPFEGYALGGAVRNGAFGFGEGTGHGKE